MPASRPDFSIPVCAAVHDLLPLLQAAATVTDREGKIPVDVIAALRDAGAYRMLVPAELGGDPVDLQSFLDVVELVAMGNGAVAWNLATSVYGSLIALTLPKKGAARIFASGPDVLFAGAMAVGGQAVQEQGGHRLTGHWRFGSGCIEADWLYGGYELTSGTDADMSADSEPTGAKRRFAFFPRTDITIHRTWEVVGLQGTGSHDYSVAEIYVPEALTQGHGATNVWPGTLYRLPTNPAVNALHFSAVATGIARRSIDSLVELAGRKVSSFSSTLLREQVQVEDAVGRAEVLLESARAYRARVVADVWATAEAGESLSPRQRAQLRLAGTHATEAAVRAVDLMFAAGGTAAIADASQLSHCFLDVHVVAQNGNVLPALYVHAGRVLLGLDSGTRLI